MIENIEEVVIAVKKLDEVAVLFEDLFDLEFKDSWMVPAERMNVKCAKVGGTQFHIVESTSSDGVIAKFIQDRGEGLHHIAFKVSNLDDFVSRLKNKGMKIVPEEPISFKDGRYIFIHPKSTHGVLIELIERRK